MTERRNIQDDVLEIYFKDLEKYPVLTPEEELDLLRRAKNGDKSAREKLVVHNLRFVVHIAKKYRDLGIPLSDLINEGNLGLLKALDKFDPDKGVRFLSYAIFWINQAIKKYISRVLHSVKVSTYEQNKYQKIKRQIRNTEDEYGKDLSTEELAKILGLSPVEIERAKDLVIREFSLDQPVLGEESTDPRSVLFFDDALPSPEELYKREEIHNIVEKMLRSIPPRDAEVLKMYYGIGEYTERMTLEDIGKKLKISRERVRQIKDRALRRLRNLYGEDLLKLIQ